LKIALKKLQFKENKKNTGNLLNLDLDPRKIRNNQPEARKILNNQREAKKILNNQLEVKKF